MLTEFSIKQEVCPAGDSEENEVHASSQKRSLTNFSIDEILKPEFGRRRSSLSQSSSSPSPQPQDLTNKGIRREVPPSSPSVSPAAAPQGEDAKLPWPAWVYCTRYSDRPSSGPRCRRPRRKAPSTEEKRPRTAFSSKQLQRLRQEFENNRYLCEQRRQALARELGLNESQVKIWFQNKRAKLKKSSGIKNGLALHLMAEGLYNHSTIVIKDDEDQVRT